MAIRNSALKYLALSAILIAVYYSCTKQNQIIDYGVLKGKISIGPLCPVERIPPDPACLPTAETYKAWATAVWTSKKKAKIATINPNLDGIYQIRLPAGDYIIDFNVVPKNIVGRSNLPSVVSIGNMDTTIFNISIDTGIR
jgi:hypothetical protein